MDTIIQAIEHGHISPRDICFDRIRRQGYADHGIRDQLNYGRNILSSQEQLAQYLFSYGWMVRKHTMTQRCSGWRNSIMHRPSVGLPDRKR